MKALRTLWWSIVAVIFGAAAGLIIGGITLVALLLMLRDALLSGRRRPSGLRRRPND